MLPASGIPAPRAMKFISVKNFERFQHYRDRNPPWIKLYVSVLSNYEFSSLPDASKAHLILIWILASQLKNKIPYDPTWIRNQIGAKQEIDLDLLRDHGFLVPYSEFAAGKLEKWPSRYIPDALKREVIDRDRGACVTCGSSENLEYDHIVPISAGGKSELSNLQLLCRSCNRKKRSKRSSPAEPPATLGANISSASAEPREETEGETEQRRGDPPTPTGNRLPVWPEWMVLPHWVDLQTWADYLAMRVKKKAPLDTERAFTIAINSMVEFSKMGMHPTDVMEQSILSRWTGLFDIKDNYQGQRRTPITVEDRQRESGEAAVRELAAEAERERVRNAGHRPPAALVPQGPTERDS